MRVWRPGSCIDNKREHTRSHVFDYRIQYSQQRPSRKQTRLQLDIICSSYYPSEKCLLKRTNDKRLSVRVGVCGRVHTVLLVPHNDPLRQLRDQEQALARFIQLHLLVLSRALRLLLDRPPPAGLTRVFGMPSNYRRTRGTEIHLLLLMHQIILVLLLPLLLIYKLCIFYRRVTVPVLYLLYLVLLYVASAPLSQGLYAFLDVFYFLISQERQIPCFGIIPKLIFTSTCGGRVQRTSGRLCRSEHPQQLLRSPRPQSRYHPLPLTRTCRKQ